MNASSLCFCGKFIPDSCTKNAPTYLIYLGDPKVIGITMEKAAFKWNILTSQIPMQMLSFYQLLLIPKTWQSINLEF